MTLTTNQHCSFEVGKEPNQLNVKLVHQPPGSQRENSDKLKELIRIAEKNLMFMEDLNMPGFA
jgi:hypothetical protein